MLVITILTVFTISERDVIMGYTVKSKMVNINRHNFPIVSFIVILRYEMEVFQFKHGRLSKIATYFDTRLQEREHLFF